MSPAPKFSTAHVIVVGSSAMDVSARVERFPDVGESVKGLGVHVSPGGKGANVASMVARLGAQVELVSAVGDDLYGAELLRTLTSLGVGIESVANLSGQTGVGHIQVLKDGNNKIISYAGVNTDVGPDIVEAAKDKVSQADVVVGQLVLNQEATRRAFSLAKESGGITILNPSPIVPLIEGLQELIDVLVVNETEAALLADAKVDDLISAKEAASSLLGSWGETIIVTCGEKGVVAMTQSDHIVLEAYEVEMIEASGAGDAFCGGLATGLGAGLGLADALKVGAACGAITATRLGSGAAQPSLDEVLFLIERG